MVPEAGQRAFHSQITSNRPALTQAPFCVFARKLRGRMTGHMLPFKKNFHNNELLQLLFLTKKIDDAKTKKMPSYFTCQVKKVKRSNYKTSLDVTFLFCSPFVLHVFRYLENSRI